MISPYFVPGKGRRRAHARAGRPAGVHIRILTNSLASTDSPLVHNGYARYRVALLEARGRICAKCGRNSARSAPRFHPFRSSNASLHAKALVIDQKTVFIGSLNMDERSARINSELGLVMRSPEIARQVTSLLDDISADGSYRLSLDAHDRIVWSSGERGAERIWHTDPETTLLQRFSLEAARAVRAARSCCKPEPLEGGNAQRAQVFLDLGAKSLAAGDGRAAGEHQDEVAAQRAVHLAQVIHIDQTGAADAQHGLRAQRLLGLAQGAARVIAVPAHPDDDIVSVRLDHLHLGHVDDVQVAVELREQARALFGRGRAPRSSCASSPASSAWRSRRRACKWRGRTRASVLRKRS